MVAAVGGALSSAAVTDDAREGLFGYIVGEVPKLEEGRRVGEGRGEVERPVFWTDRREAVEERFFRLGVDLRRASFSELELGMRRGAGC